MSTVVTAAEPVRLSPPSKQELALMILTAVVPTFPVVKLALHRSHSGLPVVVRTLVLATIAVPFVVDVLMPQLHRVRARLLYPRVVQ